MVEPFKKWLEYALDLAEVAYPPSVRVYFPFDVKRYPERVAVKASAFVSLGYMGQAVCRLESKLFEYFHFIDSLGQASGPKVTILSSSSWQVSPAVSPCF